VATDIIPLQVGGISAGGVAVISDVFAGPATVREFSIRMTGGNANLIKAAPVWVLPGATTAGDKAQTPLLSGLGNTQWLRNPTSRHLRLRMGARIAPPLHRYRLNVVNPAAPVRTAYSVWTVDRGPTVANNTPGLVHVCPFFQSALAASTRATLISATSIPYAFAVEEMQFIYATGVADTLRLSVWAEGNDTAPTTGDPGGRALTGGFGTSRFIVGDNTIITLRPSDGEGALIVPEREQWLKVAARNTDTNAHDVNAIITIRLLPDFTL
jgi:hypothetical protein